MLFRPPDDTAWWIQALDRLLAVEHGMADEHRSLTSYWRRGSRTGLR